ncbi:MAG: phosphate ABC transporter permease PstA [Bacillota bacterium]
MSTLQNQYTKRYKSRKIINYIMLASMLFCAFLALIPLFSILTHIGVSGIKTLNLQFLTNLPAPVGEPGGGMGNALVGTLILVSLAAIVGIPVGVLTAIYLSEYQQTGLFPSAVRFVADSLLGIPSIVVGIFAYLVIVLPMKSFSALAGGAALGIMLIPIVIRGTEGMLKMVPDSLREAGLALGMRKWRVIVSIVLPTAIKGIITTIMLGIARVAGETAPLLLTAFGNHFWSTKLDQPISALPLQIFTYAISPFEEWHKKAWAGSLLLIIMVLIFSIFARLATRGNKLN